MRQDGPNGLRQLETFFSVKETSEEKITASADYGRDIATFSFFLALNKSGLTVPRGLHN